MTNADFTKAVEIVARRLEAGIITGDMLSAERLVVLVRMVSPPGAERAVCDAAYALYQTHTDDLITRARRVLRNGGGDDA